MKVRCADPTAAVKVRGTDRAHLDLNNGGFLSSSLFGSLFLFVFVLKALSTDSSVVLVVNAPSGRSVRVEVKT